jgi:hypothetical protein
MNIGDPAYIQHLRDLPTSYLLDLLLDNDDIDHESIIWVLMERNLTRQEIERTVNRRRQSPWMRPYIFWSAARWLTILNALIVTYFNLAGLYSLLLSNHPFKEALLFLVIGSIVVGFIIGYKLTTHIYHGSKLLLYCGFPFPVGFVELQTGRESQSRISFMKLRMASNAMVGVTLTVFPLIFIYVCMS